MSRSGPKGGLLPQGQFQIPMRGNELPDPMVGGSDLVVSNPHEG